MSATNNAKYRADHIGSFLRPAELLQARQSLSADKELLRSIQDRHILRVLQKQKELGFEIFTDGELRRRHFMSDFTDKVDAFSKEDDVPRPWETNESQKGAAVLSLAGVVTRKISATQSLTGDELPFLKSHSPGAIKMTIPSATQFPAICFKWGISDKIYESPIAFMWAIVEIIKAEFSALAAQGVNYIQIDAPRYSYYMDPKWRQWIRAEMKVDPDEFFEQSIAADNACLQAARRPGVTLAIHLCRGNNRSHWYAEGGYDAIAEKMFGSLDVDRFLLEYDDARSGTFEPLRFVPRGKVVVLGLISSKHPKLESKAALLQRIEEASRYVPMEDLAISPQCGFASMAEGNLITEEQQWAKLQLTVDVARTAWK
jgi:5-methyltetrahydropteroyltriglutamate--homocysteine methyltransferase